MKIETKRCVILPVIRDVIAETEAKMKEMINVSNQRLPQMENWRSSTRQSLSELDKSIKQAAINTFNLDKSSKKPWDGVGIREITTYDYEPQKALVWSKENMPVIVYETIDSKQFEKIPIEYQTRSLTRICNS